jgi:hypothetical protein
MSLLTYELQIQLTLFHPQTLSQTRMLIPKSNSVWIAAQTNNVQYCN